jgi:2,3-diaminopropionate biosynthesis protein SbnA
MNAHAPEFYAGRPCFFQISGVVEPTIHVKCEALNAAGSIKIKPALRMIEDLEKQGRLKKGGTLVESSSGNLGIAVSMIAASRGFKFICVVDPNAAQYSVSAMRAVGAAVIVVDQKDENGGYLGSRIALIETMCRADPSLVWINQYANESNWRAHFDTTAPEILAEFPRVDHLFIGAGTTGKLMGCARYFRQHSPRTRIIAVDPEGSVTFGTPSKPRKIPGIGTSRRPELLDESLIDAVVHVPEIETVRLCRELAAQGVLLGGSTGSVIAAIRRSGRLLSRSDVVITIMPDLGSKYLDTIYSDEWVERHYGNLAGQRKVAELEHER